MKNRFIDDFMSISSIENSLDVIEVPQELRGLSDEEIIKNSEKPLRDISGKRKNGAKRPGKKERLAFKMQKELNEMRKAATELFETHYEKKISNLNFSAYNREKNDMLIKAYSNESESYSVYDVELKKEKVREKDDFVYKATISESNSESKAPASGRVLKASFGSIASRFSKK